MCDVSHNHLMLSFCVGVKTAGRFRLLIRTFESDNQRSFWPDQFQKASRLLNGSEPAPVLAKNELWRHSSYLRHKLWLIILSKVLLFSVIDLLVENLAAGWRRLWILRWGLFFQTGLGSNWSEWRWQFVWETDSLQLTTPSDRRIFLEDKVWKLFGITYCTMDFSSTRIRPNSSLSLKILPYRT